MRSGYHIRPGTLALPCMMSQNEIWRVLGHSGQYCTVVSHIAIIQFGRKKKFLLSQMWSKYNFANLSGSTNQFYQKISDFGFWPLLTKNF
eukprot:TRINITY_DN1655_c0_g1_i1.p1 TRINITY_DN1655_c0_g1~~TRINITY_DN1655_c0_g1_i1.p1  ORF type:complete len:90 (+),score=3.48 TRINITY_DN1655_c0_g1_i1:249-518(+)